MTTEEKLQHFLDFCMEDARSRSAKMLDEYTAALEQTFAEHQADARRRAEQQVELESERIEHETNKKLSLEQIGIKRELGHKQEELKDKIFVELKDVLEQYMETPEYTQLWRSRSATPENSPEMNSLPFTLIRRTRPGLTGWRSTTAPTSA